MQPCQTKLFCAVRDFYVSFDFTGRGCAKCIVRLHEARQIKMFLGCCQKPRQPAELRQTLREAMSLASCVGSSCSPRLTMFDLFYHHANFHVLKSLNRFDLIFHFGLNCQLQNKINFLGRSYAFYYLNDHISWVHKVNSIIGKQLRAFYNGHFWHSKMTIWQNYDLWYHPPPWHHLSFWYHPPQMTPPWQHPTPWHLLPPDIVLLPDTILPWNHHSSWHLYQFPCLAIGLGRHCCTCLI